MTLNVNGDNITYFNSFRVEHIQKKLEHSEAAQI